MGTTTILAGWDCCNTSNEKLIFSYSITFHPEGRGNAGVNCSDWEASTVSKNGVLNWTLTQKCTITLIIWKCAVLTWSELFSGNHLPENFLATIFWSELLATAYTKWIISQSCRIERTKYKNEFNPVSKKSCILMLLFNVWSNITANVSTVFV